MSELTEVSCEPCEGGVEPMDQSEAEDYLDQVEDWSLEDVLKITRSYTFDDFEQAITFVDRIAGISEREGHHPNLEIDYNTVTVTIWTHAIDGLSKNDFILAAKFDEAARELHEPAATTG